MIMRYFGKKEFLTLTIICLIGLSCKNSKSSSENHLPYFNSPAFTPEWENEISDSYHSIGKFSFTNQNGETVDINTVANKIYIANFFFTICPGICPVMTDNMYRIQEEFKSNSDFLLLSHTVTPWIDTVERLKAYADEKKVNSKKWYLLTGPEDEIYNLARASYFADKEIGHKSEEEDFLHTENFILVDKNQRIRGVYNGTITSDITRLIQDVRILMME